MTICSKQIPLTGYTPDTPDQGRLAIRLNNNTHELGLQLKLIAQKIGRMNKPR